MKIFVRPFLLFVSSTLFMLGQPTDSFSTRENVNDTVSTTISDSESENIPPANALNIDPLGALFGSAGGTYEHLFGSRHGLFAEGGYAFGNGFEAAAGYRYHYSTADDEYGLISPYWGFFISKGKSSSKYEDPDTKLKHELKIDILTIGAHWGQRFAWGESFNYNWRIGYGYPVVLDLEWPQGKPENFKTVEGLIKVFAGFDAELSVGIMF